jgi:hypothetical protein
MNQQLMTEQMQQSMLFNNQDIYWSITKEKKKLYY